jgi:hypothetical protein
MEAKLITVTRALQTASSQSSVTVGGIVAYE